MFAGISKNENGIGSRLKVVECPVQQGLVNGSPDVDAVWRLMFDREFNFDEALVFGWRPGHGVHSTVKVPGGFRKHFL